MEPLISVIIPVYNVAEFLPECLNSVVGQTWTNLEVILVDDGSTDGSADICDRYAAQDARFVVIHQENAGVSEARNHGLSVCHGKWIGFIDGDDWVEPDLYRRLAEAVIENDADVAMCSFWDYPGGLEAAPVVRPAVQKDTCDAQQALYWILTRYGYFTAVWNKLFSRELIFTENGLHRFDKRYAIGEDEVWLIQLLSYCRKVAMTPDTLYHWRPRSASASRSQVLTDRLMTVLDAKARAVELVEPYGKDLTGLAKSRLLNDSFHLKVLSYRNRDKARMKRVRTAFRKVFFAWLTHPDVPLMRKAKVMALDIMMLLHLPSQWVLSVYDMRRKYADLS